MIPPALREVLGAARGPGASAADADAPVVDAADAPGHVQIDGVSLTNMASNNYLGFARDPRVVDTAHDALRRWGLGTAATRGLSGTTTLHRELEERLAAWVGTSDAVLYSSCWTANAAVFEVLAGLAADADNTLAVFSDRLNHASIIDGVQAQRRRVSQVELYDHHHLDDLAGLLAARPSQAVKVIVTDGVFSMEGDQAPLPALLELARVHEALLVVDDSHAVGVVGDTGRGCAQAQGVLGSIDILTGTLGKALGGALGGFAATASPLGALLRARSRPYIFSNNPPVPVVAGALAALDILATDSTPLRTLRARTRQLREGLSEVAISAVPGDHPIVPIIIGDEGVAQRASTSLREHGVLATALSFPVVPRGQARLRLQVSAAHTPHDIDQVLDALQQCDLTESAAEIATQWQCHPPGVAAARRVGADLSAPRRVTQSRNT